MKPREFIKKVIEEAKKTFLTGEDIRNSLIRAYLFNTLDTYKYARDSLDWCPRLAELEYKNYNANTIPQTNIIATEGPQTKEHFENFIEDVLLNKKNPARRIIALGTILNPKIAYHQDFYNYCLTESKVDYKNHSVTTKKLSGNFQKSTSDQLTLRSVIETTLTIKTKSKDEFIDIPITLLPLPDAHAIQLSHEGDQINRQLLWDLFTLVQKEKNHVVIHCASGVGRTGHLILIFELLKNYRLIFSHDDPEKCAEVIHGILDRIRRYRPCLVYVDDQFSDAISIADELYRFALEKGYNIDESISSCTEAQTSGFRLFDAPKSVKEKDNKESTLSLKIL